MPRYVILRHEMPPEQPRGTHWDLMLEHEGTLRTWAVPVEPATGREMAAERLADHRVAYLTYEGPVSGDRGSVVRWDEGEYRVERETPAELAVVLAGRRLTCQITLTRHERGEEGYFWRVVFSAEPTRG